MPDYSKDPKFNGQWNYHQAQNPADPSQPVQMPPMPKYSDKAFLHTPMVAVGVPLLIAFASSVAIMAGTACFIWLINGYEYTKPVVSAGVATFIITWFAYQFRWVILSRLEEWTGLELDGKPGIGAQPQRQTGSTRVQVDQVTPEGHVKVANVYNLPATPAQLKAFCIGLHDNGKTLSEREWSPLEEGRPFSVDGIRKLKKALLDKNIIVRANSQNASLGYTETVVGRRIIESWRDLEDDISMWDITPLPH